MNKTISGGDTHFCVPTADVVKRRFEIVREWKAMRLQPAALALVLVLGACNREPPGAGANSAPANAAGNAAAATAVAPGPAVRDSPDANSVEQPAEVDLSVYVGKYPDSVQGEIDRVDGITFNEHPAVRRAVERAVRDRRIRDFVLNPAGPIGPIVLRGRYLVSGGCEAHNCNSHNAALLITPNGESSQLCYLNMAEQDQARWYADGRLIRRTSYCPGWDGSGEVRLDQ